MRWCLRGLSLSLSLSLSLAPRHSSCLSVSWSKFEDNLIASGDEAGYLHLHDLRLPPNSSPSTCPFYYKLHSNSVHRLSFSPSIKGLIASASDDSTAKLFHFPSQTTVWVKIARVMYISVLYNKSSCHSMHAQWHMAHIKFTKCNFLENHQMHVNFLPKFSLIQLYMYICSSKFSLCHILK